MNSPAQIARPPINKLLIIEALLVVLVTLISWQWNHIIAQSLLYGGFIFLIPTAYFAKFSFKYMGANKASVVNRSIYRGEAGKFMLTAMMFAAVFYQIRPLSVEALFISYGLLTLMHSIAVGLIISKGVSSQ